MQPASTAPWHPAGWETSRRDRTGGLLSSVVTRSKAWISDPTTISSSLSSSRNCWRGCASCWSGEAVLL